MLPTGTSLGPYQIIALLGKGGMGEVYRARDTRLGRDVAVKIITPEFATDSERIRRFKSEAHAAGALNHPNVCVVFDVGSHGESPYVVMELLEGETLGALLRRGAIPARKAIEYAAQVAHGLAAAHDRGIVHRDLKPENLFVTRHGRMKILDFGLAKLKQEAAPGSPDSATRTYAPTGTGIVLGTMGYVSPEQLRGEEPDHRTDLFALGAVLYEMLTGKKAFPGATFVEASYRVLNDAPPRLSASAIAMPYGLEEVVERCLEKAKESRFQAASDLAFALTTLGRATDSAETRPTLGQAAGRSWLRPRAVVAVLLMAGTMAAAAAAIYLGGRLSRVVDASALSYQQLTFQRGNLYAAGFSPDGKTVFYSARWDTGASSIYEVTPGAPKSRSLGLAGNTLGPISSSGMMALVIFGHSAVDTLAEVSLRGGAPRRLSVGVRAMDWMPDGKTMAVATRTSGTDQLELPAGNVIYKSPTGIGGIRVSRDGRYVALLQPSQPDQEIIIVDRAGRIMARTPPTWCWGMGWSADGRELWYLHVQAAGSSELRAIDPSGRERVVTRFPGKMRLFDVGRDGRLLMSRGTLQVGIRGCFTGEEQERELGWFDWPIVRDISRDGKRLLFAEQGIFGGPSESVCLRSKDGAEPVALGDGSAQSLSPDGRWALALRGQRAILLPTGVGDSLSIALGDIRMVSDARWLPDGKGFVFVGNEAERARRTYLQYLNDGAPQAITPEGVIGSAISFDGRQLAAKSADGRLQICPIGGGEPKPSATLVANEQVVQWTPDGRSVYVARPDGPFMRVSLIDLDTGKRRLWKNLCVPSVTGAAMYNFVVTPDGRGYAYTYQHALADLYLVEGLK